MIQRKRAKLWLGLPAVAIAVLATTVAFTRKEAWLNVFAFVSGEVVEQAPLLFDDAELTTAVAPQKTNFVALRTPVTVAGTEEFSRLVVIGDVHGDKGAFLECLSMAGLVNEEGEWVGGNAALVQMGDIFDRGGEDLVIERYIDALRDQAAAAGGRVFTVLGNHEMMNAMGDHHMASRESFEPFLEMASELAELLAIHAPNLGRVPEWAKPRLVAMAPGGPVAKLIAARSVAMVVGDSLFVHAGLLPEHLEPANCKGFSGRDCLQDMNRLAHDWLMGEAEMPRDRLWGGESPVWTRILSQPDSEPLAAAAGAALEAVLEATGTRRLFVGHTPQQMGINGAAARVGAKGEGEGDAAVGRCWRVDTGMTAMIYGRREVLEIDLKTGELVIINGTARIPESERWL